MDQSPEKRVGALARILARALSAEQEQIEAEECPRPPALDAGPAAQPPGPESLFEDSHSLDQMLAEVMSRTGRIAEERASAPAQLAELLAMPSPERDVAVATQPRFQTYALASYTLERCEKVVSHDPLMAGDLARLARAISEQADPRSCGGSAALADLESYAMAMEGNARRVSGDLREAFRSFLDARMAQERGGADPDLAARIDNLESSLRRDLRQFSSALDLLDRAERVFVTLHDNNLQARTIINRANVYLVMRDLDKVVETLRQALPLAQDPWLALCVRHNLIFALAEGGHAREAADLYAVSRDSYLQFNDPLTTSRRLWAEGLIARELDEDLALAEQLLTQAADRLAEHGYGFDAALAGLDLVTVYARRGQRADVLRVASALVHLFQVRNVHPEALAALKMVQEAAEHQSVDLALLSQAAEKVRANQVRGNTSS